MGLDDILKKINSQGEAEVHQIIEQNQEKAQQIRIHAEKEASKEAEEYLINQERQAEMEATRIMTQARLDKKIKILYCKKELIDQVLEDAFTQALKGRQALEKRVIMKDGEKQSPLHKEKIKDEIRPLIEGQIAEDLKL
jgi:vacuolar-type H+-ATPase subunit H